MEHTTNKFKNKKKKQAIRRQSHDVEHKRSINKINERFLFVISSTLQNAKAFYLNCVRLSKCALEEQRKYTMFANFVVVEGRASNNNRVKAP